MKISVVTTCFNAASTIRDCLESVKSQTYGDVEHIVVDAASTDGTLDVLEEYNDKLAKVVSDQDNGIYDGMNKGLRLATGDVVGILNADDVYSDSDVLQHVARVFEEEKVDSCYGDLVYIAGGDEGAGCGIKVSGKEEPVENVISNGCERSVPLHNEISPCGRNDSREQGKDYKVVRYWKSGELNLKKFYWGWMPPHPTFFVRRSVYGKYGLFNLELGTAADYELMLRFLVKQKISCVYLPEVLIKMRSGGVSNETLKNRLIANRMDRKAWEVNGLRPYPWTLWLKPLRKIGQWFSKPKRLKS